MRKGHHSDRGDRRAYKPEVKDRPEAPAKAVLPERVRLPRLPTTFVPPEPGQWVWTCRAGFETQLFEELAWLKVKPSLLGPALIAAWPLKGQAPATPTFARMGFPVNAVAFTPRAALERLPNQATKVQVWSPDTDAGNALSHECAVWEDTIAALRKEQQLEDPSTPWKAWEAGAWLGQVCLVAKGLALVGQVRAREAASLSAGGRTRMKRTAEAPSRAAMKLDEALEWYGVAPGKGDLCVDLGSAPGGWTRRLVERGARVWSIDPGKLAPDLANHAKVRHFFSSAFEFVPPEPVEWLFCDMAWRPLEVAQLLGKWARNRWAMQLVSNIKLPMKDKLPTLVRVRHTLESSGWTRVRMRQLYHDRDEITLIAGLW